MRVRSSADTLSTYRPGARSTQRASRCAEFGPILILVNNAGIEQFGKFTHMELDEWERVMTVNLRGPFNCIKAVVKDMQAANWGRIVNITSSRRKLASR